MKRPDNFRNGEGSGLMHFVSDCKYELSKQKCKCGNDKFEYQKVCGLCYLKNIKNVQSK
jgi:hypothetical protein